MAWRIVFSCSLVEPQLAQRGSLLGHRPAQNDYLAANKQASATGLHPSRTFTIRLGVVQYHLRIIRNAGLSATLTAISFPPVGRGPVEPVEVAKKSSWKAITMRLDTLEEI